MSAKHTPGPWQVGLSDDGYFIGNGEWPDICQKVISRNDARLIEAAPDLLLFARAYVKHFEQYDITNTSAGNDYTGHLAELARFAIAKATGDAA